MKGTQPDQIANNVRPPPLQELELCLGGSSRLKAIHLKIVGMTKAECQQLFNWNVFCNHPHLECLDIRTFPRWHLSSKSMATSLACLPKLRKISLYHCRISGHVRGCCDSIAALMSQPSLTSLELDHVQLLGDRAMLQSFMRGLSNSTIQDLSLHVSLPNEKLFFRELENMTSLRNLTLKMHRTMSARSRLQWSNAIDLYRILLSNKALTSLQTANVHHIVEESSLPKNMLKSISILGGVHNRTAIATLLSHLSNAGTSLEEIIIRTNAVTIERLAVESGCDLATLLDHVETALLTLPLKRLCIRRWRTMSSVAQSVLNAGRSLSIE